MDWPFKRKDHSKMQRPERRRFEKEARKRGITPDELQAERDAEVASMNRRTFLAVSAGGVVAAGAAADYGFNMGYLFNKRYPNVEVLEYSSDQRTSAEMIYEFAEYIAEESKKRFVIVDFHSEACPACQETEAMLAPAAAKFEDQEFLIVKVVTTDENWQPTNLDPLMNYYFVGDHYPELHVHRDTTPNSDAELDPVGVFGGRVPSERELSDFIRQSIEAWHSRMPAASLESRHDGLA